MDVIKLFEDYLLLEKKYSPLTAKAYFQDVVFFQDFIKKDFNEPDLLSVNYSMVRSWIVLLIENKVSSTSVNRKIASLKSFYKFLLKTEQIKLNPLSKHKSLKTPKTIQTPYSEKELDVLLNEIVFPETFEGRRDKIIIDLLYSTGIRRAELITIKSHNIDFSNQQIKVVGKRNKERLIPLLPSMLLQLKEYQVERNALLSIIDSEYFFLTSKGNKMYDGLVYRIINTYLSTVTQKKKKSPHMLRHTFATHLLNNGADLSSVKELLGHASLASTQVYTHTSLSELKNTHLKAHPRNKK